LVKSTKLLKRKSPHLVAVRYNFHNPPTPDPVPYIDMHEGGWFDFHEASPAEYEGAAYFKQCLAKEGVDYQTLDSKNYTMTVDMMEFDPPSPPRPDSPAWAYMYGNNLVDMKVMAETLTPENDYKRGYFESRLVPLERKVKVHYPHLDWRSKFEAAKKAWTEGKFGTFQKLKAEAAAKAVAEDVDGYIELYRCNSHFKYKDDDPFHYYMPAENEAQWIAYNQFQWDCVSSNANVEKYVEALKKMAGALGGLEKTTLKAAMGAMLTSGSTAHVKELVGAFKKGCASTVGNAEESGADMMAAVLAGAGVKGKLTKEQAAAVSTMLRGSPAAGDLEGKSVAQASEVLLGTCAEEVLAARFHATKALAAVNSQPSGSVALALLWGNMPQGFTQLFIHPDGVDKACANEGRLTDLCDSLAALKTAGDAFAAKLNKACDAAEAGLKKAGADAAGVSAFLKSSGLPVVCAVANPQDAQEPHMLAAKLSAMADDLKSRGSMMGRVNLTACANYVACEEFQTSAAGTLVNATLYPDCGGFNGVTLNQVAAAAASGRSFPEACAEHVATYLVSAGKCAAATKEMTAAVEESLGGLAEASEALNAARSDATAKMMALDLDVALAELSSLEIQYHS